MKLLAPLRARYSVGIFISLGLGCALMGAALLVGMEVLFVFKFLIAILALMTIVSILGPPVPGVVIPDNWEFTPAPPGTSEASQRELARDILRRALSGLVVLAAALLAVVILFDDDTMLGFIFAALGATATGDVLVLITLNRRIRRWEQGNGLTLMYELGKLWRKSDVYSQSRSTSA